jgi:hypothetical protein
MQEAILKIGRQYPSHPVYALYLIRLLLSSRNNTIFKKLNFFLYYVDDARIPVGGGGQGGCDVLPRSSGQVELLQACQICS